MKKKIVKDKPLLMVNIYFFLILANLWLGEHISNAIEG